MIFFYNQSNCPDYLALALSSPKHQCSLILYVHFLEVQEKLLEAKKQNLAATEQYVAESVHFVHTGCLQESRYGFVHQTN